MHVGLQPFVEALDSLRPSASEPTISAVARQPGGHVPELDGIRAFAIWGVLVAHLVFAGPTTDAGRAFLPTTLIVPLEHSWLGVDLFFVLSGFLITGILLKTKDIGRAAYFRRFYLRRALRIWPLYFLMLGVLWLAYGSGYFTYFVLCVLFIANLTRGSVAVPDGAGPFWSLAVEEQFYLVWPWLVLGLDRRRLMLAALLIVAVELIARLGLRSEQIVLTWLRADGLAMGAFIAAWFAGNPTPRQAQKLALTLFGASACLMIAGFLLRYLHIGFGHSTTISAAVCAFGALVVVSVAFSGHALLGFLRTRIAAITAMLSFSIYLLHRPVVDAFNLLFGSSGWFERLAPSGQTLIRALIVVSVCYALAFATRYLVELPFLRIGRGPKRTIVGLER